jgi:hypothetical protein
MISSSCRDCKNFEDRRDIDGYALCANNIGPYICCNEFKPIKDTLNENRLYNQFCLECANFEDVNSTPICAKNHTPRIECDMYKDRFEYLNRTKQNNLMQTVFIAHTIKHSNPKPIPEWIIKVGQKIKW